MARWGWVVLAAVAAVLVPLAFAATPARQPQRTAPALVDVGPPCTDSSRPTLQTTSDPPPAALTDTLAVLRRPQQASDRYPNLDDLAVLPVAGVNPDAIRMVRVGPRLRIYLVPAENARYLRPLPDTPACRRYQRPVVTPAPGACLLERGSGGGGTCNDIDTIRAGLTMLTSSGGLHAHVAGIAPDGVKAVVWRVHRGDHFVDTRIPVRDNVYAATVPGRAGHGLYVFYVTAQGRKLVRGPHRFTKRERAQLRREKARDEAASSTPTVFPRRGGSATIFTLRMRIAHPVSRRPYVASWSGPCGASARIGMLPALSGPLAGLVKAGIGPPAASGRWCAGAYRGTIAQSGRALARFSFSVR